MDGNMHPDLSINGVATASGGDYERVKIEGVRKVEGDIRTSEFQMNGVATIRGSLDAKRMEANGKMKD